MLARIVAAENHVIDLAHIHQLGAAGIADGALHVLLHLNQGLSQFAFDGL